MLYKVNANSAIQLDGKGVLIVQKGIWNQEDAEIELDEAELNNEHVINFLNSLEKDGEAEINDENEIIELLKYLNENGYIEKIRKEESVAETLKRKKILLIVSEEYEDMRQIPAYKDIDFKQINDIYDDMGICNSLEDMDAYEFELMCKKANANYSSYNELAFLVMNPDINKMLVLSKIMSEIEQTVSYFVIDNKLFISMTSIPQETPCFNCLNLRLRARIGMPQRKRIIKKYKRAHKCIYTNEDIIELFLSFDLALKILLEEGGCEVRSNVGSVIIWDLQSLECTKERLYKVPFCEVC